MIQLSVASDASRLTWMVGSATLTIVVSSRAMNMPAMSTISAFQALRGTAGGWWGLAVVASVIVRSFVRMDATAAPRRRPHSTR